MKKILTVFFVIFFYLFLNSCGGGGSDSHPSHDTDTRTPGANRWTF